MSKLPPGRYVCWCKRVLMPVDPSLQRPRNYLISLRRVYKRQTVVNATWQRYKALCAYMLDNIGWTGTHTICRRCFCKATLVDNMGERNTNRSGPT